MGRLEIKRLGSSTKVSCVARAILRRIEDHARVQGFSRLVLETGNRQLPAIKLYESFGFVRTAPFGSYKDDTTSVCHEKAVSQSLPGEA